MRVDLSALNSRFGRRILAVFLISALVPVVLLAVLVYWQVDGNLRSQSEERIHHSSRVLRHQVLERLLAAERELRNIALLPDDTLRLGALRASPTFRQERVLPPSPPEEGAASSGAGETNREPGVDSVRVWVDRDATPPQVLISFRGSESGVALGAELAPRALWTVDGEPLSPTGYSTLVVGPYGAVLFAAATGAYEVPQRAVDPGRYSSEPFEWQVGGYDNVAVHRIVPMPAHLGVDAWGIVMAEDVPSILAPIAGFRRLLSLVMLAALAIVSLLSIRQIRDSIEPLTRLRDGAEKLGTGDFGARVHVRSGDEFALLADSFNGMASELQHQFKMLDGMATIQRSALGATDVQPVLREIARTVPAFTGADGAAVLWLEPGEEGHSIYLSGDAGDSGGEVHVRIDPLDIAVARQLTDPQVWGPDTARPAYLRHLERWKWSTLFAVPLGDESGNVAVLCVGYRRGAATLERDLRTAETAVAELTLGLSNARLVTELNDLSWGTMSALARAIDAKSTWTQGHSARVAEYCVTIGEAAGLSAADLLRIRRGALLHDVGKIGVPSRILDSPKKLEGEDWEMMKQHTVIGARILEPVASFADVLPMVLQHHERWDGKGYPHGITGEEMDPLSRICAVADAFDAMTSDRPYRKGLSFARAAGIIKDGAGTQFEPAAADAFARAFIGSEQADRLQRRAS